MFRKLFDFNRDGKLSIFEKAARDATIMMMRNDAKEEQRRQQAIQEADEKYEREMRWIEENEELEALEENIRERLVEAGFEEMDLLRMERGQLRDVVEQSGFDPNYLDLESLSDIRRALSMKTEWKISSSLYLDVMFALMDAGVDPKSYADMNPEEILEELEDNDIDVYELDSYDEDDIRDALEYSLIFQFQYDEDDEDDDDDWDYVSLEIL
ncbi:MAG: hypothetical protein ACI4PM_00425 [Butyricicoccus sp.]